MDFRFLFGIFFFIFHVGTIFPPHYPEDFEYDPNLPIDRNMLNFLQYNKDWNELREDEKHSAFTDISYRFFTTKMEDSKFKKLSAVRSRIEHLEKLLPPKEWHIPRSRYEHWVLLLNSGTPYANQIRELVLDAYGSEDEDASISQFAAALQDLYGDLSNEGARNVVDYGLMKELRNGDERAVMELLEFLKMEYDECYVKALRIVAVVLKVEGAEKGSEDKSRMITCVSILPPKGEFPKQDNIKVEDVERFFPLTKPKSVRMYLGDNFKEHNITAEFGSSCDAVDAFNNNHGWLKKTKVHLRLCKC